MDSPAKSARLKSAFKGSFDEFESISLLSIFVGPISIPLNGDGNAVNAEKGGELTILSKAPFTAVPDPEGHQRSDNTLDSRDSKKANSPLGSM